MHRLADEAEFDDGAIVGDEARIRRAAGRRQRWLPAGDFRNSGHDQVGERPRLGHEHAGIRRLPLEREFDFSAGGLRCALLD